MEETRVSKYKEYRSSFINEDARILDISEKQENKPETLTLGATSTLPLDEVIKQMDTDEKEITFLTRKKRIRILKIVLFSLLGVLILAGLVVLGIFAWR